MKYMIIFLSNFHQYFIRICSPIASNKQGRKSNYFFFANQYLLSKKERVEESNTSLPDLYIKKFRLVEKLNQLRPGYILSSNLQEKTNLQVRRNQAAWDTVLEEMKWRALEFQEERKFKLAYCFHISKKMKRTVSKRILQNDEIFIFHNLISIQESEFIQAANDEIQNNQFVTRKTKLKEGVQKEKPRKIEDIDKFLNNEENNMLNLDDNKVENSRRKDSDDFKQEENQEQYIQKFPPIAKYMQKMQELNEQQQRYNIKGDVLYDRSLRKALYFQKLKDTIMRGNKNKDKIEQLFHNSKYFNLPQLKKEEGDKDLNLIEFLQQMCKDNEKSLSLGQSFGQSIITLKPNKKRKKKDDNQFQYSTDNFLTNANSMNPQIDFKKLKYDNPNELFTLHYDPSDNFKQFEKTVSNFKDINKNFDQIPVYPQYDHGMIDANSNAMFDSQYEQFVQKYNCDISSLANSLSQQLSICYPKEMLVLSTNNQQKIQQREHIDPKQLINSNLLQYEQEKSFVYRKYQNQNNQINFQFDIISEDILLKKSIIYDQIIRSKIYLFMIDYFINIIGNKWPQIEKAMNYLSPVTKRYLLSEKHCENIYIMYKQYQQSRILDFEKKILPNALKTQEMAFYTQIKQDKIKKEDIEINLDLQFETIIDDIQAKRLRLPLKQKNQQILKNMDNKMNFFEKNNNFYHLKQRKDIKTMFSEFKQQVMVTPWLQKTNERPKDNLPSFEYSEIQNFGQAEQLKKEIYYNKEFLPANYFKRKKTFSDKSMSLIHILYDLNKKKSNHQLLTHQQQQLKQPPIQIQMKHPTNSTAYYQTQNQENHHNPYQPQKPLMNQPPFIQQFDSLNQLNQSSLQFPPTTPLQQNEPITEKNIKQSPGIKISKKQINNISTEDSDSKKKGAKNNTKKKKPNKRDENDNLPPGKY